MTVSGVEVDSVSISGFRITFRRCGVGPPLLLLHGAVCDSRVWRSQLETLSNEFTVVAWDAPGCGGSSDPPDTARLPEFGSCLASFIDAIDLRQPHVLGHSWGSALALELYRQHPSVPRTLSLVGAYAGWAGSLPAEEVATRLRFALDVAQQSGAFEPTSIPGLFSDVMPVNRAEELATIMSEIRPVGTRVMAHALAEADLREVLPRIEVPTLLLYGDADERSPLRVANELHDAIGPSMLVVLSGVGHECYLEAGPAFDTTVRKFLRSAAV